jgi:D-alanyl-D-alanine dipeptidase
MQRTSTTPIPDQTIPRDRRRGSRSHPLNLNAPENRERAIDVRGRGIAGENYYFSSKNPPYWHSAPGSIPELFVREGILDRLLLVNKLLLSFDYELFLFDAYRPVEVQNYFHDDWVPKYLREKFPEWSSERVSEEVEKYWAKGAANASGINPLSPPPHATGGVVDLTIQHKESGEQLFMGSAFDEVSPVSFVDHFEQEGVIRRLTPKEEIARANRRILYFAMTEMGFVVNPNEWWHFGSGDQLSASISGAPHAVYSVMKIGEASV